MSSEAASSLFDRDAAKVDFPTEPAFTVPVKVVAMPIYGPDQYGIVAVEDVPAGCKFWQWTDLVEQIHHSELEQYLDKMTREMDDTESRLEARRRLLRQGFVLSNSTTASSDEESSDTRLDDFFCSNPTDAGRFMNHSANPNCGPDGTLRHILAGEEMTMDYSFHGNPDWYQAICAKYNVFTEAQVAAKYS